MQQVFRNSHSPLPRLVWQPLNWCCSSICDIWPIMTRVSHNPKVRTNSFTYVQFWRLKKRKFVQIWGISLTHQTLDARSVWRRLQSLWSRSGATCNHLLIQLINWMNNLRNWTTSLLSCDLFQSASLAVQFSKVSLGILGIQDCSVLLLFSIADYSVHWLSGEVGVTCHWLNCH